MDLQLLKTFLTIIQSGSFSGAAERLGYTRSAVTVQMRQLERELGVQLFEKVGRRMQLTEQGRQAQPYAENMLENWKQLCALSGEKRGRVRIAAAESILTFRFQGAVRVLREKLPGLELDIQTLPCGEMLSAILQGKVDLALHYDTLEGHPDICTEPIRDCPLTLFCGASIPEEAVMQEGQLRFIDLEEDGFYQHCLDKWLREKGGTLQSSIIMGSVSSLIQCVKAGLGMAILPEFALEQELKTGTVMRVEAALAPDTISTAVSYHRHKWLSPMLREVLEILRQEC